MRWCLLPLSIEIRWWEGYNSKAQRIGLESLWHYGNSTKPIFYFYRVIKKLQYFNVLNEKAPPMRRRNQRRRRSLRLGPPPSSASLLWTSESLFWSSFLRRRGPLGPRRWADGRRHVGGRFPGGAVHFFVILPHRSETSALAMVCNRWLLWERGNIAAILQSFSVVAVDNAGNQGQFVPIFTLLEDFEKILAVT